MFKFHILSQRVERQKIESTVRSNKVDIIYRNFFYGESSLMRSKYAEGIHGALRFSVNAFLHKKAPNVMLEAKKIVNLYKKTTKLSLWTVYKGLYV